jgi:lysophospholipase L1-like esterase
VNRLTPQRLCSVILVLCLVAPIAQSQNSPSGAQQKSAARALNLLVLGDSIVWGQGLRSENKSRHHIKVWLARHTGSTVIERVEAHSGAVIEAGGPDENRVPLDGEVNVAVPSLIHQLERALRYYADGSEVDLVLLSGCANDVGARNVLNAAKTPEEIRLLTEAKCGPLMETFLRRVTYSFPRAYVIVTSYYQFISEKTRNDIFMRGLTKKYYRAIPGAADLTQKELFRRMIANSDQWHRSSNQSLSEAVQRVNAELAGTKSQGRVGFARVELLPEHSFRARKTELWDFESSPLRKLLVILSFGRVLLRPNDEVRKRRAASCKEYWKARPGDTPSQKNERKNEERLCRYASLGHPNRQGALAYTKAVEEQLKTLLPLLGSK